MYGELTEKEAVERVDRALDHHLADQFEILLYKKNRESTEFSLTEIDRPLWYTHHLTDAHKYFLFLYRWSLNLIVSILQEDKANVTIMSNSEPTFRPQLL